MSLVSVCVTHLVRGNRVLENKSCVDNLYDFQQGGTEGEQGGDWPKQSVHYIGEASGINAGKRESI